MMPISTSITELIRGRVSDFPLVEILGHAYARRLTGRLRLVRENSEKTILFLNGMPVWAGSDPPGAGLIEILSEVQRLSADDLMQLRALQREKGTDDESLIRMFGLASDPEIYELHVEACTRIILEACGWKQGRYAFRAGEDQVEGKPLYDLNPLELIYHGIRAHHQQDLPELIQQMQGKYARLNHGWESTLSLPGEYFKHSHLLDHFEQPANIGEAIPGFYSELGELNDALLFLYLLLVTGILEVTADVANPRPTTKFDSPATAEGKRPDPVRPLDHPPARSGDSPAATGPAPASAGTSYIITGKRRRPRKRPEENPAVPPVPSMPAPTIAASPPSEPSLPPATAGLSDEDWLFGAPSQPEPEKPRPGLGLPDYFSPPPVPEHLLAPTNPPTASPPGFEPSAPGWGADPIGNYALPPTDAEGNGIDDDEGMLPESELMVLPDAEMPYFEDEPEPSVPADRPRGVQQKKVASALRQTREAYAELGERLRGDADHYERLGVEMDADVPEIQKAYDGILDRLALDHLPPEAQEEFGPQLVELSEVLYESFQLLTDPNERVAIEQAIYNKRKQRARTQDQKDKLAFQQWRRGKWYLENSSRADLARRCFQEALELDPKPQYFAYVGWALYRNNRSEYELIEARTYLGQALAKNPRYGEAHYFLGLIAKREGELESARNHFQEALRLNPEDRLASRELNFFRRSARPQGIIGRMFKRS